MFSYYLTLMFLAISAQLIMLAIVSSDHLLPVESKKYFKYTLYTIFVISISELASVWFSEYRIHNIFIIDITNFIMQALTPLLPIFGGRIFKKYENIKYIYLIIILNIIVHTLVLIDVAYISSSNIYDLRNFYIIDNGIFIVCIILMFWNIYSVCKNYQSSNMYILALIGIAIIFANNFRSVTSDYRVAWIAGTAGIIFMYAYYNSLINKVDSLTHLLNKRCFQRRFGQLNKDCYIVVIDLNKFKEINDEQGHIFGDYILQEIADIIQRTYNKNGTCFRIGGDEFCVIAKDGVNIESLNSKVNHDIDIRRLKEPLLPSVSVGYSKFQIGVNSQEEAFKAADDMMYRVKGKSRAN